MRISIHLSALQRTKWYEYLVRFVFGGTITVLAGLIAKKYGPVLGGLFLAFPAIFPASATLVEKHEREKKKKAGITKTIRGRQAAALDAYGASLGSVGLFFFGLIVWRFLPEHNALFVVSAATAVWAFTSVFLWRARKSPIWP
jgi:hypothetical protein